MGQYHRFCSLDAEVALDASLFGNGLKLVEQAFGGYGSTPTVVALLIGPGGPWCGHRLAVIGDYCEPGDLPEDVPYCDNPRELYDRVLTPETYQGNLAIERLRENVSSRFPIHYESVPWSKNGCEPQLTDPRLAHDLINAVPSEELFVVNFETGEHLDPWHFGQQRSLEAIALEYAGVMLALFVLLAVSNGRGGGDFSRGSDSDRPGSWGGMRVGIAPRPEKGVCISEEMAAMIAASDGDYIERPWDRVGAYSPYLLSEIALSKGSLAGLALTAGMSEYECEVLATLVRDGADVFEAVEAAKGLGRAKLSVV